MRRALRPALLALAILTAAGSPAATAEKKPAPEYILHSPLALGKDESARLIAGKILLKQAPDKSWAALALLPQDAQAAAGLLMDFQKHTQIFPKLKDIAVTPLGESRYRLRSRVQAGPFGFSFSTLWQYDAATFSATFDLDKDEKNDFAVYRGYWKFVPQEQDKTLLLYSIVTQTKNNPLAFLEAVESRKEMVKTVEEFRTALEIG